MTNNNYPMSSDFVSMAVASNTSICLLRNILVDRHNILQHVISTHNMVVALLFVHLFFSSQMTQPDRKATTESAALEDDTPQPIGVENLLPSWGEQMELNKAERERSVPFFRKTLIEGQHSVFYAK